MKKINYILLAISLISFSCTTTYRISDFSSKENFYEEFNKAAKEKNVSITLNNGSVLASNDKTFIKNDSMHFTIKKSLGVKRISLAEIKKIQYYNSMVLSGNITLKNGSSFFGNDIKILSDSSIETKAYKDIKKDVPIAEIRSVSYKNHWLGAALGFLEGIGVGFGTAAFIYLVTSIGNINQGRLNEDANIALLTFITGSLVGGTIGAFNGHTYIYQFNP